MSAISDPVPRTPGPMPTTLATPATPATPATEMTSWRDSFTLIRMALAFFFPWPFLTKNLEASAARRVRRRTARRTDHR